MSEFHFPEGVIIDLPCGFSLLNATRLSDTMPRMLVVIADDWQAQPEMDKLLQAKEGD